MRRGHVGESLQVSGVDRLKIIIMPAGIGLAPLSVDLMHTRACSTLLAKIFSLTVVKVD
jgi:hypothetical protein